MNYHEYLRYDQETGFLFWIERPRSHFDSDRGWKCFNSRFAGKRAGTPHIEGYRQLLISVPGQKQKAMSLEHRIVYEMHHGRIPDGFDIDHINGKRDDNRIENLRLATRSQNLHNALWSRGKSRLPGVSFDPRRKKNPYYARIRFGGKVIQLGRFQTEQEAHDMWKRAHNDLLGFLPRES